VYSVKCHQLLLFAIVFKTKILEEKNFICGLISALKMMKARFSERLFYLEDYTYHDPKEGSALKGQLFYPASHLPFVTYG
jgi:hypothetical protein